MRERLLRVAASRPAAGVVRALEHLPGPRRVTLTVLTYHRVVPPALATTVAPGLLSATTPSFEEQMRYVARTRRLVSAADVVAAASGEAALPVGATLVTFDDAYRDVADHAWPVLRRFDVPAVLFVPTGYPGRADRSFWWDRLYRALGRVAADGGRIDTPVGTLAVTDDADRAAAYRTLRTHLKSLPPRELELAVEELDRDTGGPEPSSDVLDWDELVQLAAEGLELAPHSVDHPLLTGCDDERLRRELVASADELEAATGVRIPMVAYPSGAHDDRVVTATAAAGYLAALTTDRGVNVVPAPSHEGWLRLRRINVGSRTSLTVLRGQMLPVLAHSRRWR